MKKTVLTILLLFFFGVNLSFAQDQTSSKIHELGLTFSNLDNFGIRYKCGNQKILLRFSALSMNLSSNNDWGRTQDSIDRKSTGYGAGFRIGFEKRIVVVPDFCLLLGSDLGFAYNYSKTDYGNGVLKDWRITPEIFFVFGAAYQIGKNVVISAEVAPSLNYTHGRQQIIRSGSDTEITLNDVRFGLSNYGASITLAYKFIK